MKRPVLTICLAMFAALAAPAAAQDAGSRVQNEIVAQLGSQGFAHVRISHTILGRVRIFATSPVATREVIFNPRTGEILRDYWNDKDADGGGSVSSSGSGSRGGSLPGSGGDDRDDGDADDRDDGNSDEDDDRNDNDSEDAEDANDDDEGDEEDEQDEEDEEDKEDKEDDEDEGDED